MPAIGREALTSRPAPQAERFGRRHAESCADVGGRGDVARVQLLAGRHAQADRGEPIGMPGAAFLGRELRLRK
jgi:hypothetical protein